MSSVSKGIACRICRFNVEGVCERGYTQPVNKTDECWTFQRKDSSNALVEHGEVRIDWRL